MACLNVQCKKKDGSMKCKNTLCDHWDTGKDGCIYNHSLAIWTCELRKTFDRIDKFMRKNTSPMVRDYWIQEMEKLNENNV